MSSHLATIFPRTPGCSSRMWSSSTVTGGQRATLDSAQTPTAAAASVLRVVDSKNWRSENLPDPPDDNTETNRFGVPTVVAWNRFASLADRGRQCVAQANAGGRDGRSGFWRRKTTTTKTSEWIPIAPDFLFCSLLFLFSNFGRGQVNQSSSGYT